MRVKMEWQLGLLLREGVSSFPARFDHKDKTADARVAWRLALADTCPADLTTAASVIGRWRWIVAPFPG
jgi:hypothetical protein